MATNLLKKGFDIIVSYQTLNRGFGYKGGLSWPRFNKVLTHYTNTTLNNGPNAMIIGAKTLLSVPAKFMPFANRKTCVVSAGFNYCNPTGYKGINYYDTLTDAIVDCYESHNANNVFLSGGQQIYEEGLSTLGPYCRKIYVEELDFKDISFPCDVFFPEISSNFELQDESCTTETVKIPGNTKTITATIKFKVYENKAIEK